MASGPKHFQMAELILDEAKRFMSESLSEADDTDALDEIFAQHNAMAAQAQVHATLALAAATAQNIRRNGAVESEPDGWSEVLS